MLSLKRIHCRLNMTAWDIQQSRKRKSGNGASERRRKMSENNIMTVPKLYAITPHCETCAPNHECPYIKHGCTGCYRERDNIKIMRESIMRATKKKPVPC